MIAEVYESEEFNLFERYHLVGKSDKEIEKRQFSSDSKSHLDS